MKLNEQFVKDGINLAKGSTIFGVPIEELSREELIAVAAHGWDMYRRQLQDHLKSLEFLTGTLRESNESRIDFQKTVEGFLKGIEPLLGGKS